MNLAEGPTFPEIGKRMEAALKPQWTFDLEYFENTGHALYFVMDDNRTVATCRRREDAERIVNDHNRVECAVCTTAQPPRARVIFITNSPAGYEPKP